MAQVVEQELRRYLPEKDEFPSKLHEAMHYSTLSGCISSTYNWYSPLLAKMLI